MKDLLYLTSHTSLSPFPPPPPFPLVPSSPFVFPVSLPPLFLSFFLTNRRHREISPSFGVVICLMDYMKLDWLIQRSMITYNTVTSSEIQIWASAT